MKLHERLKRETKRLTRRERELASYMLANGVDLAFESASSIARRNSTSAATVVRLFAKLGYSGYAEVRAELQDGVSERLKSPAARSEARGSAVPSLEGIVAATKAGDIANLEKTMGGLDLQGLRTLVTTITSGGGRVFIMGERYSLGAAHILSAHLNLCRRDVILLDTGASMAPDRQMWVEAEDLLLCISLRRYATATLATAEYFSSVGASVISLTDSLLSPVAGVSDHTILVASGGGIFDSHTALIGLVHVIIEAVAAELSKELKSSLPRADRLWARHKAFVED